MSKPANGEEQNRETEAAEAPAPVDPALPSDDQSGEARLALEAQLAAKDREIADLKDKYLRALAEQENARKRTRQQAEESIRLQREGLLRDLLPIVDNLELAVAAARDGENGKSIVEGIELVLRSLHDLLRGHGVTVHDAIGRIFDPQFHEAVDHVESLEYKPNTVVREYHRGYQVGDRVLRPARVAVAKAPSEQPKGHDEASKQHRDGDGGGPGESEPEDVEND